MTKTGGSKHKKRIASPRNLLIERKKHKFTFRANPGPYAMKKSIPLGVLLRDILKLADTKRELKNILNQRLVKIDGKIITNPKFPLGLMAVIEIEKLNKSYRILPHELHLIMPYEIKKATNTQKACQIMNKSTTKNGAIQLNLHDGRNIILPKEAGIEQKYNTKDTVILDLPSQQIINHFPFKEGMFAIITAGQNVGKQGIIKEFTWRFGPTASTVTLSSADGVEVQTTQEYIFVIGEQKPWWLAKGDDN